MTTPRLSIPPSHLHLPPDSLILVTGANGLITSHAADQLLAAGYRVRGTVRSAARTGDWLTSLFASRHGPGRFEVFELPHLPTNAAGWVDALGGGVVGVAHVMAALDLMAEDVDAAVREEMKWQTALLEAAVAVGTVKSFVFTSSAWATYTPRAGREARLDEWSWNDEAVALARDKSVAPGEKGLAGPSALKTLVEKGVWEWVREKEPPFAFNTVLGSTVIGECLDPVNQGMPSTAGIVWGIAHPGFADLMPPQWQVDCRDLGRLFVALLATAPVVDRQRIYGFGARFSWHRVVEIITDQHPELAGRLVKTKDAGWDQTEVPNHVGAELLARLGQTGGWRSLEESVEENVQSWLKRESTKANAGATE